MVKLVNTLVSKTSAARLPGSIPGIPTKLHKYIVDKDFRKFFFIIHNLTNISDLFRYGTKNNQTGLSMFTIYNEEL